MRKSSATNRKSEAEKLADDVRLLNPRDNADAFQIAMNIIADALPEVSAEDVITSSQNTRQRSAELASQAANLLFPLPTPDKPGT